MHKSTYEAKAILQMNISNRFRYILFPHAFGQSNPLILHAFLIFPLGSRRKNTIAIFVEMLPDRHLLEVFQLLKNPFIG